MNCLRHATNARLRARAIVIACGLLLGAGAASAQNQDYFDAMEVRIANVAASPRDAKTAYVRFDIAWDDSWRHEANHDAAWVFFKVRATGAADWQHARLAADKVLNPAGYGQAEGGTPLDFIVPDGDDGFLGVFVRRSSEGKGELAARNVTAVWDLTASKGIAKDTLEKAEVRAFGVIVVYVAEGPFHLGSGGAELDGFYQYTDGSQASLPYKVTGPGAIPTGRQQGRLWVRMREGDMPEDGGEIPAAFPNGYGAFYCMRHHLTNPQYAAFVNTLSPEQAEKRVHEGMERSGTAPNYVYSAKSRSKGNAGRGDSRSGYRGYSWADGAAWAAWAGLRPMSELEYEKTVRGPRTPQPDESGPSFWNVDGFHAFDWHCYHPFNQCDRPVTVGNAKGRGFRGTHGRGTPDLPADWPQDDAVGAGFRGGGSHTDRSLQCCRVSDRRYASLVDPERSNHKWRGARTAPKGVGN